MFGKFLSNFGFSTKIVYGKGRSPCSSKLSCLADESTILLSGGETMQTISIISTDNNVNSAGTVSESIRSAIKISIDSAEIGEYAFWIHSIKEEAMVNDAIKDDDLVKNAINYDLLLSSILEETRKYASSFSNYQTIIFLTIIKSTKPVLDTAKKLFLSLSGSSISYNNWIILKKSISKLNKITDNIISQLNHGYTVKKLAIDKNGQNHTAEHVSFLDGIINLRTDRKKIDLSMCPIYNTIGNASKVFNAGKIKVSDKDGVRYSAALTIKDISVINGKNLSDLISICKNAIFFESFYPISKDHAQSAMKNRLKINAIIGQSNKLSKIVNTTPFLKNSGDETFFDHHAGIVIIAKSESELSESLKTISENITNSGSVIVSEDIGLERSFYSMIPGNFQFRKHRNIATSSDICKMSNSYVMDNSNVTKFIDQKPIMLLPTLKRYGYQIGLLKEKSDILVSSTDGDDFGLLYSRVICANIGKIFKGKILNISENESLYGFTKLADGDFFSLPSRNDDEKPLLSMLSKKQLIDGRPTPDTVIMLRNILSENGIVVDDEKIKLAIERSVINGSISYDNIMKLLGIDRKTIQDGLAQVITSGRDCIDESMILRNKKSIGFNLGKVGSANRYIIGEAFLHILKKFISSIDQNQAVKNTVLIQNVVNFINHPLIFNRAIDLFRKARAEGLVFIFFNTNHKEVANLNSINSKMKEILSDCSTHLHFCNFKADEKYKNLYDLTNGELYAMQSLFSSHQKVALLKQDQVSIPILVENSLIANNTLKSAIIGKDEEVINEIKDKISNSDRRISSIVSELISGEKTKQINMRGPSAPTEDIEQASKIINAG